MDKYRIDSHKLIYHVPRVNDWLAGKNISPIYMEISPTGSCNHRCTFCALDYMEYQPRSLDYAMLKTRLTELAELGLKSVMYAGEGEPFLHKQMDQLIADTKQVGIDVALTTNGVLLTPERSERILKDIEWIKVSINAGSAETYSQIHRTKAADFDKVIDNLREAVKIRERQGGNCALGMQMLLLPENQHEAEKLAAIGREIGINYLVIKPYSQHLKSNTTEYQDVDYRQYMHLSEALEQYSTDNYKVLFRANTMKKLTAGRSYSRCLALPFWSYIDAGGGVWGCSAHLGDERFLYGNINDNSFAEIWQSEQRAASLKWVEEELDCSDCRSNCRMDEINRYLWELQNPMDHVNFI